jgi:phage terminase large subunit-like protein
VIFAASPDDDCFCEETWKKCNPNYGISVKAQNLLEIAEKAKRIPSEQVTFKQLHCNVWADQVDGGIDMEAWKRCTLPIEVAPGDDCYIGIDLSSKLDLTALVAYFPRTHSLLCYFWLPEANIFQRKRREVFDYPRFARARYVKLTSGNWVDQTHVRKKVNALGRLYNVVQVGYDSWNSSQLATWLQDEDGFEIMELRQGFKTMSEPAKNMMGLVADGLLRHGGNPVLRKNASNVVWRYDANANIAPKKFKEGHKRIDGMVAAIMAIGLGTGVEETAPGVMSA